MNDVWGEWWRGDWELVLLVVGEHVGEVLVLVLPMVQVLVLPMVQVLVLPMVLALVLLVRR